MHTSESCNNNINNTNSNSNSNNKKIIDEELYYPFDINYSIKKLDLLLNSLIYNSKNEDIKQCNNWIIRLPPYCSRLQSGYNCGFVALRMAIEYLDRSFIEKEFISDLFLTSVMKGYTKEGEMFSSWNLSEVSNLIFNNVNFNFIKTSVEQFPSTATILNQLSKGKPILVPYDADQNWRPCSNGGKRAHWAMIIGYIIPNYYKFNNSNNDNSNNKNSSNIIKYKISNNKNIYSNNIYNTEGNPYDQSCNLVLADNEKYKDKFLILNNTSSSSSSNGDDGENNNIEIKFYQKSTNNFNKLSFIDDDSDNSEESSNEEGGESRDIIDNNNLENLQKNRIETSSSYQKTKIINNDEIFLICQHGKSQFIQLWEYQTLYDSNNSLSKFPDERRDDSRWIIPNDLSDLRNKWLFFNK